jgi:DNA-binding transcriptional MerR regulator
MTSIESANNQCIKIGELARRTGASVRTLHYYDEIGLLRPTTVTASRHRLYGPAEMLRLQQIKSLRSLGFSLDEVRACLDAPEFSPARAIEMHVQRLRDRVMKEQRLIALLETLAAGCQAETMRSAEDFITVIEEITTIERCFTPDELDEIKLRGERLGAAHIKAVEREWPMLIAKVRGEMLDGTDPRSPRMQPLASRWRHLVREFTGGNPNIEQKVRGSFVADPKMMERNGLDPTIFAYANAAIRALDAADD